MPVSSIQFGQQPWAYANGLGISNDATTPDEIINVAAGSTLDTSGLFQIISDSTISVDITKNGVNGLDTGTVAASTVYAVYLIADPQKTNPVAALISTGYISSLPTLPTGYSIFALVGFLTTDASSDILLGNWIGAGGGGRRFVYATPQATAVTAGNDTTYTEVDLSAVVPGFGANNPFGITPFPIGAYFNAALTPNAAENVLNMRTFGNAGDQVAVTGQVSTVQTTAQVLLPSFADSGVPKIEYKVTEATDAAAITVFGYDYYTS